MKEIKLSQQGKNKGKYVTLVDDEDFEALNQHKWYANKIGKNFYAVRNITADGKQTSHYMHDVIMNGKGIDHRDGNGLNNQRNNLRFCTNQENCMNRRKKEGCTSIYKGVDFFKRNGNWRARIQIHGKKIHFGCFVSEVEAAKAYNQKAIELFGEFANLNNIN